MVNVIINYSNCVIKLHLKKKYSQSEIGKIDYGKYILSNDLYTELLIGTPSQKITTVINFNKEHFYIAHPKSKGIFNSNLSKSFYSEFSEEQFNFEEINSGYISFDTITLNSKNESNNNFNKISIPNFVFTYSTSPNFPIINYGSIGLLYKEMSFYKNRNFIVQLKYKKIIYNYGITFYFLNDTNCDLFIGEYPHEYNNSFYDSIDFSLIKIPISHQINWNSYFKKITYGNYENNRINNFFINVSFGGIVVDSYFKNFIEEDFFNKVNCDKKIYNNYFYYECNSNINIKEFKNINFFHNDINYTFVLSYKDLFEKINGRLFCKLFFNVNNNNEWNLGLPFLKKYLFTFDEDKKIFGFYKKIKLSNKISILTILIFFLLIIILILVLILLRYIKKNNKKINANELEDKLDYIYEKSN